LPRKSATSTSGSGALPASRTPNAAATAEATSAGSASAARETYRTPSRRAPPARAAASSARRVLPTPPGPVSVSSRAPRSRRLTSASSRSRPTKLVSGTGRLPGGGTPDATGGTTKPEAAAPFRVLGGAGGSDTVEVPRAM
jgi:hypothetical protein